MRRIFQVRLCLLILLLMGNLAAQNKPDGQDYDVKEHYTKYEYRIAMRDGVHLFTSVYVPKDSSRSYPFLIDRTPYAITPYGEDQGGLYFCISRCARALHVGGNICGDAPAHRQQEVQQRRGR
jgi:hypothetical protein